MQIFKDTVALAFVLLLALTLRIDTGSTSIDRELATPAQAAASVPPQGEPGVTLEVEAALGARAAGGPGCPSQTPHRVLTIEQRIDSVPRLLREIRDLPPADALQIEIVPEATAAPAPKRLRALSC